MITNNDELCYFTATEALALYRKRSLSPVELLQAVIERSEAVNPKINAYTYTFYERALDQAKKAENKFTNGKRIRRLEGVPVVIKDDHNVKGEITTHGSLFYEDNVPDTTTFIVERILQAGAIMIARSTTPEFANACICHSPLWGVTRNPWNPDYSPGGSTGGGAAALAAGMTTLSDGCDVAGSIRIPAALSGVFGYKPPAGRNPSASPWNLNRCCVYGPLSRSVADGALLQNVMSGPHKKDITSLPNKISLPLAYKPLSGWKIALSLDLGYFRVDPEVRESVYNAAKVFKEMGCEVNEVELPWTDKVFDAFVAYARAFTDEPSENFSPEEREKLAVYNRVYTERVKAAFYMGPGEGARVRAQMYDALGPVLETHHVLICPVAAVPGVSAELSPEDDWFEIDGVKTDPDLGWVMTYPFNMLSQLPAASVPNGFSSRGLPIGLQIVGRPFDDVSVFRAAAAFEQAQPWDYNALHNFA